MTLTMYYGTECGHCHKMMPLIDKLKEEEGIEVEKLETWHNSDNKAKLDKVDDGKCGGVPFFMNSKTGKFICGATDYESFKSWAKGK